MRCGARRGVEEWTFAQASTTRRQQSMCPADAAFWWYKFSLVWKEKNAVPGRGD